MSDEFLLQKCNIQIRPFVYSKSYLGMCEVLLWQITWKTYIFHLSY